MIIFGIKASLQKSEYIFDPCPNCGANNSMQINIFQRYAHVFWIPFFPTEKTGFSVCSNCRQVLQPPYMTKAIWLSYDNVKRYTRMPIWSFSGILLIIASSVAGGISDKHKARKVSKFILSAKKDDIFEIKLKSNAYTLYKVQKVSGDTVYFYANEYQASQETGISELFEKKFNTDMTYGLSTKELVEMDKKQEILDIDRK